MKRSRSSKSSTSSNRSRRSKIYSKSSPVDIIMDLLHRVFGEKFTINRDSSNTKDFSVFINDKRCVQFSINMGSPPEIHID